MTTQSLRSVPKTIEVSAIYRCIDLPLRYEIKDGLVSGPSTYRVKIIDDSVKDSIVVLRIETKSAEWLKERLREKLNLKAVEDVTSVGSQN